MKHIKFLLFGILFGIILTKAEVISWYRIQEMFLFESFHMYGVIGSAVIVGLISIQLIKFFNAKSIDGNKIELKDKKFNWGMVIGGVSFGLGWALTGACPGPFFALIGNGYYIFLLTLLSAIGGTYLYGRFRDKLPH